VYDSQISQQNDKTIITKQENYFALGEQLMKGYFWTGLGKKEKSFFLLPTLHF